MTKCACPVDTLTTNIQLYTLYDKPKYAPLTAGRPTGDLELICGHNTNNLQVHGRRIKSKIWPNMLTDSEEYEQYLERFKQCRKDIYDLYFKDPPVDISIAEDMFKNLSKTAYQLFFSPNVFEPCNEERRFARLNERLDMKYHETTYGTYYSRIKELERFRDALRAKILDKERKELKEELKKIYRCGRTTYMELIGRPATVYAKKTLPCPIDRHTNRRF